MDPNNYQAPNQPQGMPNQSNQQNVNITLEQPQKASNGKATASLVLGILALLSAMIPVVGAFGGIVMSLIAIPLGATGLSTANKTGHGKGVAMTGLILGILAFAVVILWLIAFGAASQDLAEHT